MTDENTEIKFEVDTDEPETAQKKSFFNGKRRPNGKWMIGMVVVLFVGILAASASFLVSGSKETASIGDAAQVHVTPTAKDVQVGGKATPDYNAALSEHSAAKAVEAEKSGSSYIPPPTNNNDQIDAVLKPVVQPAPEATKVQPRSQQEIQNDLQQAQQLKQVMKASLDMIAKGMELQPQETQSYIKVDQKTSSDTSDTLSKGEILRANNNPIGGNGTTVNTEAIRLPGGVHSGSILYATNDIKLNSDGKNPVVRATVASGPLKNYVALGSFVNGGESLALSFSRLVSPDGHEYKIEAYGIDPTIPEANIASDVDHHYLQRWGAFSASAFLTGFANATQMAGTSSVGYGAPVSNNGVTPGLTGGLTSVPMYSMLSKGIIAMGSVGTQVGTELRKDINRPATVTLDPGVPMGILIISVGVVNGNTMTQGQGVSTQQVSTAQSGQQTGFSQVSQYSNYESQ